MLILKLVIILSALVGILTGFNWFNKHCYLKFGHTFSRGRPSGSAP